MKSFWGWVLPVVLLIVIGCTLPTTSANGSRGNSTDAGISVPSAPTQVTAVPGVGQVTLSWTAVPGASSYNLYWATTSGFTAATGTKVAGVTSGSAQSGFTNGTTYYFLVTAVNAAGESSPSPEVNATPQVVLPTAPTGVSVTAGNGQLSVTWAAVSGATGYNLYWSAGASVTVGSGTKVAGVSSPYALTGLANSTVYRLIVTAVNGAGEGPASAVVSGTPQIQWTNITTANGLVSNTVYGLAVSGSTIWAATDQGISISQDGGATWTTKTAASLGGMSVNDVAVNGSTVVAGLGTTNTLTAPGGVAVSTDGGLTWTNSRTTNASNGLGYALVTGVALLGTSLYAADFGVQKSTDGGQTFSPADPAFSHYITKVNTVGSSIFLSSNGYGLDVSTDGGGTWNTFTKAANGLGSDSLNGVAVSGSTLYAATNDAGVSVSTDGGLSWTTHQTFWGGGYGNLRVRGIAVSGSTVYAATGGGGLAVSYDGGTTWTGYTSASGLGSVPSNSAVNDQNCVVVTGGKVYVGTSSGIFVGN
jgi:hypothetical protein